MRTELKQGVIFNIQNYSIHDGPGIRTTVFLKGCPLRCLWCQNPESQDREPVLIYDSKKCTGCGQCIHVCPSNAIRIEDGVSKTDRTLCNGSADCVTACNQEARSIAGEIVTAGHVFEKVIADRMFYENSGGGVTISGGDPLGQPDFTGAILELCSRDGIHTAVDTCGFAKWETLKRMLNNADLVLYDLKHFNNDSHRTLTGASNKLILENAQKIYHDLQKSIRIRIPLIPGYNDSTENIENTAGFITQYLDASVNVHLIPYHRLGQGKLAGLEKQTIDFDVTPPDDAHLKALQMIFSAHGLTSVIGG